MDKLFIVLRQEYLLKVRTKAFLFGTFVVPLLMARADRPPGLLHEHERGQARDRTPWSTRAGCSSSRWAGPWTTPPRPASGSVQPGPEEPAGRHGARRSWPASSGPRVADEKIGGFLLVPAGCRRRRARSPSTRRTSPTSSATRRSRARWRRRCARSASAAPSWTRTQVTASPQEGPPHAPSRSGRRGTVRKDRAPPSSLAYAVGFIFYISLLIYGAMMLRAALEEKTSRSAEVMVATVRASTLMAGKILGIGLVGLTQLAIWAAPPRALLALRGLGRTGSSCRTSHSRSSA